MLRYRRGNLHMRAVMSRLERERATLGDREPIRVTHSFIPRRQPAAKPTVRPVKRRLSPWVWPAF
jgi:hypothetical protein